MNAVLTGYLLTKSPAPAGVRFFAATRVAVTATLLVIQVSYLQPRVTILSDPMTGCPPNVVPVRVAVVSPH